MATGGAFAHLQDQVPGYFRDGEEANFPWAARGKAVWYALFVVEDGKIQRYGFTSAQGQKALLRETLMALDGHHARLYGVWTGEYGTHLFELDVGQAIEKLA